MVQAPVTERSVPAGGFPETRWTLVLQARSDPSRARAALEQLVRPRWKPLYAIARAQGLGSAEAEDAVQGFIAHLLEGQVLQYLDPHQGLLRELFQFGTAPAYAELSARHGMTIPQLKSFVHRARARFRELLRQRVSERLSSASDVDDELALSFQAMNA